MKLETHTVDEIEIFVLTVGGTRNLANNDVSIVVPATAEVGSADESHVIVANADDQEVVIWFPEEWWKPNFLGGGAVDNPLRLEGQGKRTYVVDAAKVPVPNKNGIKELEYQIYATKIREFSVGDSPPSMVFKP